MAERIVSPGVFTREKDLSFLPLEIQAIGAAVVGPTLKGPAFVPTTISSYEEYLRAFGGPFSSGSGTSERQYKFLTDYVAQEYLRYAENLTVVRVLAGDYEYASSNVVTRGAYAAAPAGIRARLTGSYFNASQQTFKLTLVSPGNFGNSALTSIASNNGVGSPADDTTGGALNIGNRENLRWEVRDVNTDLGTFDLYIRRGDDRHNRKVIVEQYNDLTLDPNDTNYIGRVIGDQMYTLRYDSDGIPFLQLSGSFPNRSRYIRVEVFKENYNYLNESGQIRVSAFSSSLPAAVSGTFSGGSDGYVKHPRSFFDKISGQNSQGFNLDDLAGGASGSTAYKDAIDILANADEYDINMLLMPGIIDGVGEQHGEIITKAIAMIENRGDIFMVIDPTRYGDTIGQAINAALARNTSYAAYYYPWVQIADADLGRNVWVPPSTVVSGVIAFNDYVQFPWYAPAGLNRGAIDVALQAERKLTLGDRDRLYTYNINPIATYPREGVVVWGQKTLQKKRSALDRINVRRLLIAAKKFIASSSRYLVFEQNTKETRLRFLSIAEPYLESVRRNQGLYDFRVIMDESNNTPDVLDRNELRGAIYLKPTRTAEFIILDFFVLPTGASFPGDTE